MNNDERDEALAKSPSDQRLTPELIQSKIAMEQYIVPADLEDAPSQDRTLTVCVLTLQNGFQVVGKSACADPKNFNEELGRKIAYDDAFRQVWQLEGYLLRDAISNEKVKAAA